MTAALGGAFVAPTMAPMGAPMSAPVNERPIPATPRADVEAALSRAEGLGATREYGPNQVDDHTWTGMFRDPAGNPFGVYRHGPH